MRLNQGGSFSLPPQVGEQSSGRKYPGRESYGRHSLYILSTFILRSPRKTLPSSLSLTRGRCCHSHGAEALGILTCPCPCQRDTFTHDFTPHHTPVAQRLCTHSPYLAYCITMVVLRVVKKIQCNQAGILDTTSVVRNLFFHLVFLSTSIKLTSQHVTRAEFQALLVLTVTSQLYPNYIFLKRDQKIFLSPRHIGEVNERILQGLLSLFSVGQHTGWKKPLI